MPVSELMERLSWAELLHWIAFYTIETDAALPPEKRPIRAKTPEEAAKALDSLFKITTRAKKKKGKP